MPLDIAPYIDPSCTAVLVSECQNAVLGELSPLLGLVASAKDSNMVQNLAGLLACARQHGVKVFHCLVARREDGRFLDPVLDFHLGAGAQLVSILPGYRPGDADSRGYGVMIEYEAGTDNAEQPPQRDRTA